MSTRANSMRTLINTESIAIRTRQLAEEISRDYEGRVPVLVGLLKGSVYFLSDLIRYMSCEHEVDFISISSYGSSTESSGIVRMLKDLERDVSGRDLIIVEDIIDSGISLDYICRNLASRNIRSLRICTLLDKRDRREREVDVHYVGFIIPNEFVVGFGLDFAERFRHLSEIAVMESEDLENISE
ncbi:MAG: hypoxanthine phosphoribosyltransferase [Candidatus Eisenbacteria bacterium]|uniref:Hypoxanthine phosphoribosyltransferase n=1 Tax=Eiseniibacteriota bacterium TaxID=2212470 RepID=A0A948S0N2_UNCEI|nr:hypoxanthine phosphoribosyltransferase [Candidatus Eisenbacteria bacterium]MBU1947955.1 hypoxanthine phosphoribosyltransferase [Candidatus Eisenbacteria bacterium]MBU2693421.1 hypoxanthine phosphoribosyltransferase [Candidatus Eisenbacteria bacterium]